MLGSLTTYSRIQDALPGDPEAEVSYLADSSSSSSAQTEVEVHTITQDSATLSSKTAPPKGVATDNEKQLDVTTTDLPGNTEGVRYLPASEKDKSCSRVKGKIMSKFTVLLRFFSLTSY